jgi:hypothetical protein
MPDSYITLSRALEEEPHDKDLQGTHADNKQDLNQAEVDDPLLGAANSAKVAVLASAEVFLVAGNGRKLARDFEQGLLEHRCLLRGGAWLRREGNSRLVLDLEHGQSVRGRDRIETAKGVLLTEISKSTNLSAKVLISLLKQNLYSPTSLAVKTKSPCRSFWPCMMNLLFGPVTS